MNLKKMLLLASMALAAIAFAAPATASADPDATWTHDDKIIEGNEEFTQSFEGFLQFDAEGVGTFGCEVTATITATAGTTAHIDEFNPTTSTCVGTGGFTGCELVTGHTTNITGGGPEHEEGWHLEITTHDLLATHNDPTTDIEIHNTYKNCLVLPMLETTQTLFPDVTIEPVLDELGTIETLVIADETNIDTSGKVVASGELHLHDPDEPTLGLATHPLN